MAWFPSPAQERRRRSIILTCAAALLAIPGATARGQQAKPDVLRIGTSGTLATGTAGGNDEAALDSLRSFIKEETGLNNELLRQKSWSELAAKMAEGELHLGVFQGYEFA